MSNVGIDSFLQITAPARPAMDGPSVNDSGREQFRAHLERASEVADTKPKENREESVRVTDEDEPLQAEVDQQETSTKQQEEATPVEENQETNSESAEAAAEDEQPADEVDLSAAAVVATEVADSVVQGVAAATAEQGESGEVVAEGSATGDQQQATKQPNFEVGQQEGEQTAQPSESAVSNELAIAGEAETVEVEPVETPAIRKETAKEKQVSSDAARQAGVDPDQRSEASVQQTSAETGQAGASQANGSNQTSQQAGAQQVEAEVVDRSVERSETKSETKAAVGSPVETGLSEEGEVKVTNAAETVAPVKTTASGTEANLAVDRISGRVAASNTANASSEVADAEAAANRPTVDRARFVQRVGGAIRAAQQRDGQIQLRLSPPELGTLKIEIAVNNGAVTAKLETENAAARSVLLDNLPALRERLAEQEIRIEKFDVDVRREGQQQSEQPSAEEREANQRRARAATANREERSTQTHTTQAPLSGAMPTDASGLDVRI